MPKNFYPLVCVLCKSRPLQILKFSVSMTALKTNRKNPGTICGRQRAFPLYKPTECRGRGHPQPAFARSVREIYSFCGCRRLGSPHLFGRPVHCRPKNQADITRCFFKEWNEQTKKWQKPFCGSSFFRPIGSTPKQRFLAGYYDPVVWGKLYRADFIKKEQIKFLTGATAEDSSFSILTFMTAKRIHTVPKSNYYYRREVPFCITSQKHTMDHGTLHNRLYLCDEFARRGFLTPEVAIALLRCVIGALRQLNKGGACLETTPL